MEYKVSKKANITSILLIVVGLTSFVVGLLTSHGHTGQRLWANLLVNGYFFFGISLASLFFVALQYIAEMAWGVTTQRVFQATLGFMPVSAIALLLVFLGGTLHWNHIYHWMAEGVTDPTSHHYDKIIAGKSDYLNQTFFWVRTIMYFGVWMFFANWFVKKSKEEDQLTGDNTTLYKKKVFMGVLFIAFFAYTSSSSAWDWLMSIDVHWFSTMYGWYAFSGMFVSCIIVALLLTLYLKSIGYLKEVNDSHIHDLGKWTFATSMLWSYIWFSQFMLIWYSNIPEEVTYYLERFNDYRGLYLGTFAVNFALPFFVLMSRDAKKNVVFLLPVALIIFFTHWLDVLIMVLPGTMHDHGTLGFVEIGMFLMFLGLFIMITLRTLSKSPLMPKNHPMYDESIHLHT
ncbi:MAG: quinol:cytochrome C oxidoreductase [Flavobacteriales bacterium]